MKHTVHGLLVAAALAALAACSDPGRTARPHEPTGGGVPPAPDAGQRVITPEECEAEGGTFVASPGGEVSCPEGTTQIAAVRFGIEGGVCCR